MYNNVLHTQFQMPKDGTWSTLVIPSSYTSSDVKITT